MGDARQERNDEIAETVIVLTLDDGPRREVLDGSSGLLALLKREHVPATFFVQGWQAKTNADLARRIVESGHLVANHTYGHATPFEWAQILARMDKRSWQAQSKEERDEYIRKGKIKFLRDAERGREVLISLTGSIPLFLRPPKWAVDQNIYCELSRHSIVQMIPERIDARKCLNRQIADSWREQKEYPYDVNTSDYEVIKWYADELKQLHMASHNPFMRARKERQLFTTAAAKIVNEVGKILTRRERRGFQIHVLVFHEHKIVTEALRALIPEWRQQGIRLVRLEEVYGL